MVELFFAFVLKLMFALFIIAVLLEVICVAVVKLDSHITSRCIKEREEKNKESE